MSPATHAENVRIAGLVALGIASLLGLAWLFALAVRRYFFSDFLKPTLPDDWEDADDEDADWEDLADDDDDDDDDPHERVIEGTHPGWRVRMTRTGDLAADLARFRENHGRETSIDAIDGRAVAAICEACDMPIFDGDSLVTDVEGDLFFHRDCVNPDDLVEPDDDEEPDESP